MKEKFPAWAKLTLITLIAGLLLGCTYMLTKDLISKQALHAAEASRRSVFEEAESFRELELEDVSVDNNTSVINCFEAVSGDSVLGYVSTVSVKGYGGTIEVTVGMDLDGVIKGISVGGPDFGETPGLGAKTKEAAFTSQFKGLALPIELKKNGGEVDAVTAATISSKAVTDAVRTALTYMQAISE